MKVAQLIDEAKDFYAAGKADEAVARYRRVLKTEPENAEALYGWALVAYDRNNLKNAEKLLGKALAAAPEHAAALTLLGCVYMYGGWYGWAARCFRKALRSDAGYLPAYNNLALIMMKTEAPWQAEKTCREGIAHDDAFAPIYNTLSHALIAQSRSGEALAALGRGVTLTKGRNAEFLCNLGVLHLNRGERSEAEKYLRRAIKADPVHVNAHYTLSGVHKYKKGDPHIKTIENVLAQKDAASEQAGWLHFALGKAWDDTGNTGKAFHHYAQGNFIIRSCFKYKTETTLKNFAQIKKDYGGAFMKRALRPREEDPVPVFIVGLPRSGTTLAEQILFAHPKVAAAGEVLYLQNAYLKHRIWSGGAFAKDVTGIKADILRATRDEYMDKLCRHAPRAKFITDKMPMNFERIGLIRLLFPQAKIIHCRRDPMDNCFSIYKCVFNGLFPFAYDLRELGQYYKAYDDLMAFWHERLPGFIHDVQYEELVAEPERVTRDMLAFCGLSWNKACLEFHKKERAIMTASALQVRKPLYKKSIGSWHKYENHLGLLKKELG